MPSALTAERLRELLHYEPDTGVFTWRVYRAPNARVGDVAGTPTDGYINICVDARLYRAHRLAWLYVHGVWPEKHLDHRRGDGTNNRIDELRDVSQKMNNQNQVRAQTRNGTGLQGVTFGRLGKFRAQISINGKKRHLGTFTSKEAAHAAFLAAKRVEHEGCTI